MIIIYSVARLFDCHIEPPDPWCFHYVIPMFHNLVLQCLKLSDDHIFWSDYMIAIFLKNVDKNIEESRCLLMLVCLKLKYDNHIFCGQII